MKKKIFYCLIVLVVVLSNCKKTKEPVEAMSIADFAVKHLAVSGAKDSIGNKAVPAMRDFHEQLISQPTSTPPHYTLMACCMPCTVECCVCSGGGNDSLYFMGTHQLNRLELIPKQGSDTVKSKDSKVDNLRVFALGVKDLRGDYTLRIIGDFGPGELRLPVRVEEKKMMRREE